MRRKIPPRDIILAILLFIFFAIEGQTGPSVLKPNIVIIVADDLGWADVGYHGSPIRTPNIDQLATGGIELNRFYVCPVCSPTRTGLMTGRYPNRTGMHGSPTQFVNNKGLPPGEVTLAEMLREAGYEYRHAIGKWHLGTAATVFHPIDQGFTSFYGHYCGMIDFFEHSRGGELDWHRDYESSHDQGYSTRLMSDDAVRFIESVPDQEPFFLYLAYNAVHTPIQAPDKDIEAYRNDSLPNHSPTFAAMLTVMDEGIGQVRDALKRKGVSDNTIVWFISDNGGTGRNGKNFPLRGFKNTSYEGGIRVPAAISWPARLENERKIETIMGYVDIMPTLAAITGVSNQADKPWDGINVLDILDGKAETTDRAFYPDRNAVVTQRWKLVDNQLFDLENDPYEQTDLATEKPEIYKKMHEHLEYFHSLTGPAYVPPGFPPTKDSVPAEWKMPSVKIN
jgi:arylsulfatase B